RGDLTAFPERHDRRWRTAVRGSGNCRHAARRKFPRLLGAGTGFHRGTAPRHFARRSRCRAYRDRHAADSVPLLRRKGSAGALMEFLGLYNYWVFAILLMTGLYAVISRANLVKQLIGMSIFQSAVFLLYISMDKVEGGTAPIIQANAPDQLSSNPSRQVLIVTALGVGFATLSLGLAIVVRFSEAYGTTEGHEMR